MQKTASISIRKLDKNNIKLTKFIYLFIVSKSIKYI